MNNLFTILFAADSGYARHLAAAIYSLLVNNLDLHLKLIVFAGDMPDSDKKNIERVSLMFGVELKFIDLDDDLFEGLKINYHFQKSNYYRLFAGDLIDADACLYLDSDLIVNGSIKELLCVDLENKYLAAVENPGFDKHARLGMRPSSKYFNSGVMLINLNQWRAVGLKERVISFVRSNPDAIEFVDQCGLNAIVDGNWIELDKKYNLQTCMLEGAEDDFSAQSGSPIIVHFTGSSKPWHLRNKHPYKWLYWYYRNMTPYKSFLPDDFGVKEIAKLAVPGSCKPILKRLRRGFK